MNKVLVKFCKQNSIRVIFTNNVFQVVHLDSLLYQSSLYSDCINFIWDLYITDKHTNKLFGGNKND